MRKYICVVLVGMSAHGAVRIVVEVSPAWSMCPKALIDRHMREPSEARGGPGNVRPRRTGVIQSGFEALRTAHYNFYFFKNSTIFAVFASLAADFDFLGIPKGKNRRVRRTSGSANIPSGSIWLSDVEVLSSCFRLPAFCANVLKSKTRRSPSSRALGFVSSVASSPQGEEHPAGNSCVIVVPLRRVSDQVVPKCCPGESDASSTMHCRRCALDGAAPRLGPRGYS